MNSKQNPADPLAALRGYVHDWWWPTLWPRFLVFFVGLFVLTGSERSNSGLPLLLLYACYLLTLLSPLLGGASARSSLRRASPPPQSGSWLVTATAPWWSLAISLCCVGVTAFSFVLASALGYMGFLVGPAVFLIGHLVLEIFWFRRCFRDASRVAVLEKGDDPASLQAFRLLTLDGLSKPVAVREYDNYSSSVYLMEGDSEVLWKVIGSIETLAVELQADAKGKTGKTQGI